jgi:DNA (cytosine-5)-methyltransferase 1
VRTEGATRRKSQPKKATQVDASVVDIFCGAGGLSHGFLQQGFRIVGGVDVDEECRYAFESNNHAPFIRRDVTTLTAQEVNRLFVPKKARVLVGCAPCQPFSTYNQKNKDPKWQLLRKFSDLVAEIQPDVLSMENVPRLLTFKEGKIFDQFVKGLREANYQVAWDVLYCPDFGLAQTRSRLVLLASKLGPVDLPTPTHKGKHRTVRQEIGKLREITQGGADDRDLLHRSSRLSPINQKRIASAKPGGTWRDWNKNLVADCHKEETGRGYSSVYGRMEWDAPSPTITTQFYGFGNGRFGHPGQDRALSLREGALLQSFPPDYGFVPPGKSIQFKVVGRLIGNAVPVRLAAAIAKSVKNHIEGYA